MNVNYNLSDGFDTFSQQRQQSRTLKLYVLCLCICLCVNISETISNLRFPKCYEDYFKPERTDDKRTAKTSIKNKTLLYDRCEMKTVY